MKKIAVGLCAIICICGTIAIVIGITKLFSGSGIQQNEGLWLIGSGLIACTFASIGYCVVEACGLYVKKNGLWEL